MAVLELTKGSEGPVLTGKAVYGGEPVEGVFVALVADPPATPLAFDATDEYGRFTLPRCERGEAIILWKREGETLLVARDSVADVAEETLILELEPWPFFTEVAASLIRFDPASGLTLPAVDTSSKRWSISATRLKTWPGMSMARRWKYTCG